MADITGMNRKSYNVSGTEYNHKTVALRAAQELANQLGEVVEVECAELDRFGVWFDTGTIRVGAQLTTLPIVNPDGVVVPAWVQHRIAEAREFCSSYREVTITADLSGQPGRYAGQGPCGTGRLITTFVTPDTNRSYTVKIH